MEYSDWIASLSLLFAIGIGIINYSHTKRSVRNTVMPYLAIIPKAIANKRGKHSLVLEIQNLHHEISVDHAYVGRCILKSHSTINNPEKINNFFLRHNNLTKFVNWTNRFTNIAVFHSIDEQATAIIKPTEKISVKFPSLEDDKLWEHSKILKIKDGQYFVNRVDYSSKYLSIRRDPKVHIDVLLTYKPAVFPVNRMKSIHKFTIYPEYNAQSEKLTGWSIVKRQAI